MHDRTDHWPSSPSLNLFAVEARTLHISNIKKACSVQGVLLSGKCDNGVDDRQGGAGMLSPLPDTECLAYDLGKALPHQCLNALGLLNQNALLDPYRRITAYL